ncbi:MAG: histidine kinase, partial [Rhodospirillales bacterium]|nr:histidine kinase [Rhodospirillales bacterium]
MIGHLLKVSSNLLIYRAIVLSCFRHPYELLFLRLSRARDQLEATVLERTRELSQANAILQDEIVQRRAADEKLRATVAELERSNNELEQFAYVASHDLQEPLRMVTSYTQLLHRRYVGRLDQDADDFIHFAVDGARRMERMIHDLLDYSRVHSRGQPLEPVESRQAIAGAVNNLRSAIEEVQATLDIPADPPLVMADVGQLERLFQNLIGNAIKYRRPGVPPRVTVSAERQGGFWRFEIADNGIGIDPQYYERIFMVFQRLHTREQYPGTGIGLAICKKIVDRHGGHIGVRSI